MYGLKKLLIFFIEVAFFTFLEVKNVLHWEKYLGILIIVPSSEKSNLSCSKALRIWHVSTADIQGTVVKSTV